MPRRARCKPDAKDCCLHHDGDHEHQFERMMADWRYTARQSTSTDTSGVLETIKLVLLWINNSKNRGKVSLCIFRAFRTTNLESHKVTNSSVTPPISIGSLIVDIVSRLSLKGLSLGCLTHGDGSFYVMTTARKKIQPLLLFICRVRALNSRMYGYSRAPGIHSKVLSSLIYKERTYWRRYYNQHDEAELREFWVSKKSL